MKPKGKRDSLPDDFAPGLVASAVSPQSETHVIFASANTKQAPGTTARRARPRTPRGHFPRLVPPSPSQAATGHGAPLSCPVERRWQLREPEDWPGVAFQWNRRAGIQTWLQGPRSQLGVPAACPLRSVEGMTGVPLLPPLPSLPCSSPGSFLSPPGRPP